MSSARLLAGYPRRVLKLVVLISGTGSNLRALLEASEDAEFPARVVALGADPHGEGRGRGEALGVPPLTRPFTPNHSREAWGAALIEQVRRWDPDLVILSGLMRLVPPSVVDAFSPGLVNTHPAYLPEFPGAHAVRDALAAGATETGASLIVVDDSVDGGPIIAQERVPVLPGDTETSLHDRIKPVERRLLIQAVLDIANSHLDLKELRR